MSQQVAPPVAEAPQERPLGNLETFRLLLRAFEYLRPVRKQMAFKLVLNIVSLWPIILLPWPAKILIDHVIEQRPIADTPTPFPFFMQPLVDAIDGTSPATMATAVFLVLFGTLLLVGGWSTRGQDRVADPIGRFNVDIASRSERAANAAWSFAGGLLGYIDYRWTLRLTHRINHHYRSALFERIQRLPMARVDDQRVGDAVYRVMYDTPAITSVCYRMVLSPLSMPFNVGLIAWVLWLSYGAQPVILWTAMGILPAVLLITFPFSGAIRRAAESARSAGSTTTTTIEESITNVMAVQGLGGQAREKKRFDDDSWRSYGEFRRYALIIGSMIGLLVIATISLGLFVFYELTDMIFADRLTIGDMGVLFAYYVRLAVVSGDLAALWVTLQDNSAGMRRVFATMDLPEDHQPAQPKPLPTVEGGFVFEDVGFCYPDGTRALTGASFEAKRGKLVALAGPAGAGKTTLAYMVPRFLWPSEGRILIDGVDLTEVDREDLRKNVAFVFQEPTLFDATIAENIRVGKPDASDEEVRRAAEVAGALEFIEHMPQGFDTPLGRNGGRLSVGQKQRLSIARALVRDAPVLVLDEPTAALDPETELRLVAALREASRDKLVIVIAHRLSTIRHADQILFLQDGQIRERGSHAELMAIEGGAYRRFVELQRGV